MSTTKIKVTRFNSHVIYYSWIQIIKLSLNVTEAHFTVFHNIQTLIDTEIIIKINNSLIDHVSSTKFLGVIIYENLTWSYHNN